MTTDELELLVLAAIQEVAPEIEKSEIDFEEDIREECDLDSMDFLNYLGALQKSTGIKISESDYIHINTFNKMIDYIALKLN